MARLLPLQIKVNQNPVSKDDLIKIVEKASTITDRLGPDFLPIKTQENDDTVNSRLEKWCQVTAQGNQEQFDKRLAWDSVGLGRVRRALGSVSIADEQNLPAWTETLKAGITAAALVSPETLEKGPLVEDRCLNPQEPIPFEEIFLPFIEVARQKLIAQASTSYYLLSEVAHVTLERSLLQRLSFICSQSLHLEFSVFVAFRQSPLAALMGQSSPSKKQYRAFIKDLLGKELLSFFQEYSVLARLVGTVVDFWVEATSEFLQRLASDWLDIQQTFQGETELEQVVALKPRLSDPHNQGRSVIGLTFASGLKLIYKPRDLGVEAAYFDLLAWCNQHGAPLSFKTLTVINRHTYGWVEYVEHLPCQDREEAKRYYQRAGMLLCVLYALEGTDCHGDNLIASGEHPVLIDMEMLLHHYVRKDVDQGDLARAQRLANERLGASVLRTGLLPRWQFGSVGQSYDISALGYMGGQETPFRKPMWKHINTDRMALGYEDQQTPVSANMPSINGIKLSPNDYLEELVDGFRKMYRFFVNHRKVIQAPDGPLAMLAHQRVRHVFRTSQVYASVLNQILNPKYLRDGADHSIQIDILSRAWLSSEAKPPLWSLLRVEQQALELLDVPLFTAAPGSDALVVASNQTIEKCFAEPSYDRVIARLNQLNERDLEQQIGFIRGSLYLRIAGVPHRASVPETRELHLDKVVPIIQEEMVKLAIAIAADHQRQAICAADGSATWITPSLIYTVEANTKAQQCQLQPVSFNLFEGCCGVAFFLAALERVTGGSGFRDLALAALQSLRLGLRDPKAQQKITQEIDLCGIGGAGGYGSLIYALVRIGQFLDEKVFWDDAKQVASLITPGRIAADRRLDIISGAAGAILGLLTLHKATGDPDVLTQAVVCGQHLLDNRVANDAGLRAWATLNGKLLTGFSHGAAGIAYALLRLYKTSQDSVFLAAAQEAIAYERSVFSPETSNWLDFRYETPSFMTSWCHGAPGIGLARLGSLAILDTPEIRQDIEIALNTTQQFGLQGADLLCCGNFGRIDTLLVAAQHLSRPELFEIAKRQASWLVERARKTGSFYLSPKLPKGVYIPGLFMGTAGIGYELIRLAYPDSLPSVLLWE